MPQFAPEARAKIRLLFQQASEMPPAARAVFLDRECTDRDVRLEVLSLLRYDTTDLHTSDAAIAAGIAELARETDPDERLIGAHLGPYKVEAIAGHGGMGAVYRAARDDAEFRQQVAIKLVRAAAQSPSTLQRFKQERQILARLAHPNIARLLDGGSTPDGMPYLVMEFIEGEAITDWCERRSLNVKQRLRLFLEACDGVEFAHRNQVAHRDLKPGNILVTSDGTPKLLDFGIAKMLVADADSPAATTTSLAMTPEYAAPEQVRGEPVTKAVDVYALGVILYEILTGVKAQQFPERTPHMIAQVVCQMDPIAPAALQPRLRGDLDTIIRMAMRKEPQRRYGSVADLARDIRLHLAGYPVAARADTMTYRTAKFLRRNRAPAAMAAMTVVLVGGAALAYWVGATSVVPRVLRVTRLTQTGHADNGAGLVADGSYVYFVDGLSGKRLLARVPIEGGPLQTLPVTLDRAQILDISPDRTTLLLANRGGEEAPLWAVPTSGGAPRQIGDAAGHAAAWSPDGATIVFARGPSLFRVNLDGSGLRKLLDTPGIPYWVRWSPLPRADVLRYAVSPGDASVTNLWEARSDGTRAHILLRKSNAGARPGDVDDTGEWISSGRYFLFRSVRKGEYSVWARREAGRFLGLFQERPALIYSTPMDLLGMAASPDGKHVFFVSGQEHRHLVRYDRARDEFVPFMAGVEGRDVSFSADGRRLTYTAGTGQTLWCSRSDGTEARQLCPSSLRVWEPNWSPDGAWIVFTGVSGDGLGGIWLVSSAGGSPERLASTSIADGHAFWSPDGSSLLFRRRTPPGVAGCGLYVMDWKTKKATLLPGSEEFSRGAWSPDSRHIAATEKEGEQIQVLDLGTRRWTLMATGVGFGPPYWSSDSRYVYYQESLAAEQPIFRVRIGSRKIEKLMTARQVPQSDLIGYGLVGLTPDGAPIASVVRPNADIYALDLDLP
jgi:Tol biopolymer transport system component